LLGKGEVGAEEILSRPSRIQKYLAQADQLDLGAVGSETTDLLASCHSKRVALSAPF
jgi:hypothetical protein